MQKFQVAKLFNEPILILGECISKDDLQLVLKLINELKLNRFSIRHDDEGWYEWCQIRKSIWVNHLVDIVSVTDFNLTSATDCKDIDDEVDVEFIDEWLTIEEFKAKYTVNSIITKHSD